jgi:hypothetical protein
VTGTERITLHESGITCPSTFIAAGVNAKAFSTYLGHSSIQIARDRYGHLMPGNARAEWCLSPAPTHSAAGPAAALRLLVLVHGAGGVRSDSRCR